jgi:hypothetical protein
MIELSLPRPTALLLALATMLPAATLAASPAAPPAAAADGFTQRGAHEHGKVTINLAVEGGTLTAELDSPAINVVGFERAPRDAAEKARVAEVDRWLASGVAVLGVPAAAGCVRSRIEYTPPALGGAHAHDEHDEYEHEHEHDHEPDGEAEGHSDYDARFTFTCSNPAALAWVDLWLLRRLVNVAAAEVNLVTPQQQTQLTVTGRDARVALR